MVGIEQRRHQRRAKFSHLAQHGALQRFEIRLRQAKLAGQQLFDFAGYFGFVVYLELRVPGREVFFSAR